MSFFKCSECGMHVIEGRRTLHGKMECDTLFLDKDFVYSGVPLRPEEEKREIKRLWTQDELVFGRSYFVLSYPWLSIWKDYVSFDEGDGKGGGGDAAADSELGAEAMLVEQSDSSSTAGGGTDFMSRRPPPIDNSELLERSEDEVSSSLDSERVRIRQGVVADFDYVLVPAKVWQRLQAWYGGGPEIKRRVIRVGWHSQLIIDLFPVEVLVIHAEHETAGALSWLLSVSSTWKQVRFLLASNFMMPPQRTLIEVMQDGKRVKIGEEQLAQTLEEAGFTDEFTLFLSNQPRDFQQSFSSSYSGSGYTYKPPTNVEGEPPCRGVVGLHNLGNTCFMNSALQCLANLVPLAHLMLTERYKQHLNSQNPMGTRGKLSDAFAAFLREVWSARFTKVVPMALRKVITSFAPQFKGYQQHDAQELLGYVLSGLHEDMLTQLGRNESPINALFGAMLHSNIACQSCGHESEAKQPYMYLQLPVPEPPYRNMAVMYFGLQRAPRLLQVRVKRGGTIANLLGALSEELERLGEQQQASALGPSDMIVLQLLPKSYHELAQSKDLETVLSRDVLAVYERPLMAQTALVMCRAASHRGQLARVLPPFLVPLSSGAASVGEVRAFADDMLRSLTLNSGGGGGAFRYRVVQVPLAQPHAEGVAMRDTDVLQVTEGHAIALNFDAQGGDALHRLQRELEQSFRSMKDDGAKGEEQLRVPLEQCIHAFTSPEYLPISERWMCSQCSAPQAAIKTMQLWTLPAVLVIHLKRFKFTMRSREKLHTLVQFPPRLDLSEFVASMPDGDPSAVYHLRAVSNHSGGLSGGHYTALAYNADDEAWWRLDDSRYSKVSDPSTIVSSSAYLLFYVREDAEQGISIPDVSSAAIGGDTGGGNNNNNNNDNNAAAAAEKSATAAEKEAPSNGGDNSANEKAASTPDATSKAVPPPSASASAREREFQDSPPALDESLWICGHCEQLLPGFEELQSHMLIVHNDSSFA